MEKICFWGYWIIKNLLPDTCLACPLPLEFVVSPTYGKFSIQSRILWMIHVCLGHLMGVVKNCPPVALFSTIWRHCLITLQEMVLLSDWHPWKMFNFLQNEWNLGMVFTICKWLMLFQAQLKRNEETGFISIYKSVL